VVFFDDVRPYDQLNPRFAEGLPALAVEVVPPDHRIGNRIAEFLKAGIPLVWVIDPEARDVTVYRQGKDPQVFDATQELTGDDVLPDLRVPVAELFYVAGG
jgi:Uma2 family endonuclease